MKFSGYRVAGEETREVGTSQEDMESQVMDITQRTPGRQWNNWKFGGREITWSDLHFRRITLYKRESKRKEIMLSVVCRIDYKEVKLRCRESR